MNAVIDGHAAQASLTNDQVKTLLADLLIRCRQLEIENAALQQALEKLMNKNAAEQNAT